MRHTQGFTGKEPYLDKHNHVRCPICNRFIKFEESISSKEESWHSWSCEYCWAYNEHFHSKYDESRYNYNDTAKECYNPVKKVKYNV